MPHTDFSEQAVHFDGRVTVEDAIDRVAATIRGAHARGGSPDDWLIVTGRPVVTLVIPANGIQLIRSFAEHRARPSARERIAVVEGSWILGPLFLFNNLHSLHHEAPSIPWYEYIGRYRQNRERLLKENGGLVYDTYFDVARRHLFRPHDEHMHPTGRVPLPLV